MSPHPLIIADKARIEQFQMIGTMRGLFRSFDLRKDADGVYWGEREIGEHVFAVSSLGPNRAFDMCRVRKQWGSRSRLLREHRSINAGRRIRRVHRAISDLRLGMHAARLLWAIHGTILAEKTSLLRLPDLLLGEAVWGRDRNRWPRHWRSDLLKVLDGLTWLHVATAPKSGPPRFGPRSALLTHVGDLRGTQHDTCGEECAGWGGLRHHHFLVNVGRGFLGVLEKFGEDPDRTGVRAYKFPDRGPKDAGPTLSSVGKTGHLVTVYIPAVLGDRSACEAFTADQHRLLQAIVRETTKSPKKDRNDISVPEVLTSNETPSVSGKKKVVCPLLDGIAPRVGFNGNKRRRGLGYLLLSPGGWLSKAGYNHADVDQFLTDLAILASRLGLIPVGIERGTERVLDLREVQSLTTSMAGRSVLNRLHLRIYTAADYLYRWNEVFKPPSLEIADNSDDRVDDLLRQMKAKKISRRALANGIGADPSFVNKLCRESKPWPGTLLTKARDWIASYQVPRQCHAPVLPLIKAVAARKGSMVDVALAYRERGWSVIPQIPGAKKPLVKWKRFQERLATKRTLVGWFREWSDAGLAIVLGPVSGLLVVDVDGPEAHKVLVERLGGEPVAPKVLSGSRKPFRYHLVFEHPDLPTKAKSTPWHPGLEFRGRAGIVVAPPSLHSSGYRYAWAKGQSLDDLPIPPLPDEILAALKPATTPIMPAGEMIDVDVDNIAPSTREFLSGKWSEGPRWNDRLFRAACDLHARGFPLDEVEPLLLAGAKPWNQGEAEAARRSIQSAYSATRSPSRY